MSEKLLVPRHLTPVGALTTHAAEVVAGPDLQMERDAPEQPKTSRFFPGRHAYRLVVETTAGTRTKKLPDGKQMQIPVLVEVPLTVWSAAKPQVSPGEYVRIRDLMCGAVDGHIYCQAGGVELVEAAS